MFLSFIIVFGLMAVIFPVHVSALDPNPVLGERVYNIKSVHSGLYLDVYYANVSNGTNVSQYTYIINAACQEWLFTTYSGVDYCRIQDINSGSLLSIVASSGATNANAWIWEDDGTAGQKFKLVHNADDSYCILTYCSNYTKALAIDCVTTNGMGVFANLRQEVYNNSASNQRFILEPCSRNYIEEGSYYIMNSRSQKFAAMDDQNSSNTNVFQWDYTAGSSELFMFKYVGIGYYKIVCFNSGVNSGKVLGVENNSGSQDALVKLYDYSPTASGMKWKFSILENGHWKITPKSGESNNRVLCKADSIIYNLNGTNLQQRTYLNNNDYIDEWKLILFESINTEYVYDVQMLEIPNNANSATGTFFKNSSLSFIRTEKDSIHFMAQNTDKYCFIDLIKCSDILFVVSHGSNDTITMSYLSASENITRYDVNALNNNELSNCDLLVLCCCECAKNPSYNIAKSFFNKGVKNVIAFNQEIYTNEIPAWLNSLSQGLLYQYIDYGEYDYEEAAIYADMNTSTPSMSNTYRVIYN